MKPVLAITLPTMHTTLDPNLFMRTPDNGAENTAYTGNGFDIAICLKILKPCEQPKVQITIWITKMCNVIKR